MLLEETTSAVEEGNQQVSTDDSVDSQNFKSLYDSEVGNAKKQRQRAQTAEQELAELKGSIKKQEEASMVEQNKFKELYENEKVEKETYLEKAKQFDDFVITEKESLLGQLSEEDREEFKDLPLKALKKVVSKITTNSTSPMKPVAGAVKQPDMKKPYAQMTEEERKLWFNAKVQGYGLPNR